MSAPWRRIELPNKRIKQTSLAAALGWQGEVPPRAPQGQIGGRTASQLIRGVGRTPWVRVIDRATDMTALLVIDMQVGLFTTETPRFDADGVVGRINALARAVHESDGIVIFIQHDGPAGDAFEPGTSGWQLLPSLERDPADAVVHKTACDSFYETELEAVLGRRRARRLLVTGCATDFCVDTTVRAAMSREYQVVVVADGHTTADRPHVDAASLIQHHNWLWHNLIHPKVQIEVVSAGDLIARIKSVPCRAGESRPTSGIWTSPVKR